MPQVLIAFDGSGGRFSGPPASFVETSTAALA